MVHKQKIAFKGKIEIIGKTPYTHSGPRGIDVYTRRLTENLSQLLPHESLLVSHDESCRQKVNLVHYTFFDPFFLTLWRKLPPLTPFVVTIHDLIPLRFPEHFPSGLRGQLKFLLQKHAVRRAFGLITDSEASRADIIKYLNYPSEHIHVIPLAVGSLAAPATLSKTVLKEYGLTKPYLLYVGDINWNKNVVGLINAFSELKNPQVSLVLVGKAFAGRAQTPELQSINEAIRQCPHQHLIKKLGFVPTHHLSAIYKGATLYVQPSWYEGFGFPVLEALSQGTPVLSSDQGSLPEVGGKVVHYFDPRRPRSLATKLDQLLNNQALRTQFSVAAVAWAKQFTWKKVAAQTMQVYEKYAR